MTELLAFVESSHLNAYRLAPEGSECRVLVVGEDNPYSGDPSWALWNHPERSAGHRLQAKVFALPELEYQALWRTNLCLERWNTLDARLRAIELMAAENAPWNVVVLLGAKVAKALRYPYPAFSSCRASCKIDEFAYEDRDVVFAPTPGTFQVVSIPHPSGRNLVWNNRGSASRVQMMMRIIAPEISWGSV